MGKSITQQARGRGGPAFRIRKRAYVYRINYPNLATEGKAIVLKLINSLAHSSPLAKMKIYNDIFFVPATDGLYEGQFVDVGGKIVSNGNILKLRDMPQGTKMFNVESYPGSGGKYIRASGCYGVIGIRDNNSVEIIIKRKRLWMNENCRAIVGVASGDGRLLKPIVKAGKKHFMMKSVGRKWHRTSPIKTNAVDHPFGSGRGKRIKSKIAIRNAPPGAKVGHIRPRRTGRTK